MRISTVGCLALLIWRLLSNQRQEGQGLPPLGGSAPTPRLRKGHIVSIWVGTRLLRLTHRLCAAFSQLTRATEAGPAIQTCRPRPDSGPVGQFSSVAGTAIDCGRAVQHVCPSVGRSVRCASRRTSDLRHFAFSTRSFLQRRFHHHLPYLPFRSHALLHWTNRNFHSRQCRG